jgi:hypothetical protein
MYPTADTQARNTEISESTIGILDEPTKFWRVRTAPANAPQVSIAPYAGLTQTSEQTQPVETNQQAGPDVGEDSHPKGCHSTER